MKQHLKMGEYIKGLRKENKLTQDALALYLGVTTQFISNVERGVSSLPFDRYIKICKAFNIAPATLIDVHLLDVRHYAVVKVAENILGAS